LLNATALKNHMESKRHKKRQKVSEDDEPNPICLAEDVLEDESVSTLGFSVHGLAIQQTCAAAGVPLVCH